MDDSQLGAVILAAGRGSRMGMPKLRLCQNGESFFERLLDQLRQAEITTIISVVAQSESDWARQYDAKTAICINPNPEIGMLSSIRTGIAALHDCAGLFIVPVDHPFISVQTFRSLKDTFVRYPDAVVKPCYQKKSGHPIILPQRLFAHIQDAALDSSLRMILKHIGGPTEYVDVADPGILRNINEWQDLHEMEYPVGHR